MNEIEYRNFSCPEYDNGKCRLKGPCSGKRMRDDYATCSSPNGIIKIAKGKESLAKTITNFELLKN